MSTLVKMPHCWKSHVAAQTLDSTPINVSTVILNGLRFSPSLEGCELIGGPNAESDQYIQS